MSESEATVTCQIRLQRGESTLEMALELADEPAPTSALLPLARALTDKLVELKVIEVEAEGKPISCRAGCGACCRQLVPISEPESRRLAELVAALPEPRRSVVRARFEAAARRLDAAGLLEPLRTDARLAWDPDSRNQFGIDYFRLGVPCPFLEEESCSIYAERPMSCREYLVTSPAEFCARPKDRRIEPVRFPAKVWASFAWLSGPAPAANTVRWVPLIVAPDWASSHPEEPPTRTTPELVRAFLSRLTRTDLPGPESTRDQTAKES